MCEMSCCIEPPLGNPDVVIGWLVTQAIDSAMLRRLKSDPRVISKLAKVSIERADNWKRCNYEGTLSMRRKFRQWYHMDWNYGKNWKYFGKNINEE